MSEFDIYDILTYMRAAHIYFTFSKAFLNKILLDRNDPAGFFYFAFANMNRLLNFVTLWQSLSHFGTHWHRCSIHVFKIGCTLEMWINHS